MTVRDVASRRQRRAVASITVGSVLQLPQLLLAQHKLGALTNQLDFSSYVCSLLGALVIGVAVAALFRSRRERGRVATAGAAIAAIAAGLVAIFLANVFPSPFITSYPPAGVPTTNGVLSVVFGVLIFGSGAAALAFTAQHVRETWRRFS
jgi:membrane-associated HD superfamily phosphohydrolase